MLAVYKGLVAIAAMLQAIPIEKEEPLVPVDVAFGYDSSATKPQVSVAEDGAAWDRLWGMHRGTTGATLPGHIRLADDRPPVDFRANFVLAVFGGTTQEIEGYTLHEIVADGKTAYIRFRPVPPALPGQAPRVTQPYGFVILPRTKMNLEVQMPAPRNEWRTVAKFDPTRKDGRAIKKG